MEILYCAQIPDVLEFLDDIPTAGGCAIDKSDEWLGRQWKMQPRIQTGRNRLICPKKGTNYSQRGAQQCGGIGSWAIDERPKFKCHVKVIGSLLKMHPGDLVLDWGAGCGYHAYWFSKFYGVDVFAIDATETSAEWARQHVQLVDYCVVDGLDLDWLPSHSFNHVIAYAALYHFSYAEQCATIQSFIRLLLPGGSIWIGWARFKTVGWVGVACDMWRTCVHNQPVDVLCQKEGDLFGVWVYEWEIYNSVIFTRVYTPSHN